MRQRIALLSAAWLILLACRPTLLDAATVKAITPNEAGLGISAPTNVNLGQAAPKTLSLTPLGGQPQTPQTAILGNSISASVQQPGILAIEAPAKLQAPAPTRTSESRNPRLSNRQFPRTNRIARAAAAPLQILGRTLAGLVRNKSEQESRIFFDEAGKQPNKAAAVSSSKSNDLNRNRLPRLIPTVKITGLATPLFGACASLPFLHSIVMQAYGYKNKEFWDILTFISLMVSPILGIASLFLILTAAILYTFFGLRDRFTTHILPIIAGCGLGATFMALPALILSGLLLWMLSLIEGPLTILYPPISKIYPLIELAAIIIPVLIGVLWGAVRGFEDFSDYYIGPRPKQTPDTDSAKDGKLEPNDDNPYRSPRY